MKPLILFDRVSYRYETPPAPAIQALANVSLELEEGSYTAVVGANGSGKSTFARLACALLQPDTGSVQVAGLDTRRPEDLPAIHAHVGMVFQFPEDQVISTTVEEDVAFGPENMALPPDEIRRRVEDALQETGLWEMRHRSPHLLSAGQVQRLALAGVLALRPRCIIFDEASTMLDPRGRRALMETMQRLHREGITILTITHFMEEAAEAQRVIVLSGGQVALDGAPEEIFASSDRLAALRLELPPAVRAAAVLRRVFPALPQSVLRLEQLIDALPWFGGRGGVVHGSAGELDQGMEAIIEAHALGHIYMRGTPLEHRSLDGASLRAGAGQIHGLIGKTGSGKSTLLQHLNGLLRPQEGRLRVAEFDMNDPRVARRDVVRKVGLVFQNPEAQFFTYFTGDEIAYGVRQLRPEAPLASQVRWAMQQVGLDFDAFKDRPLFTLSGGERRKAALASTLAVQPEILLLDEPTAGLDPRTRLEILERLDRMRAEGMTIILSSHQMEDLAALAHHVTAFYHGKDALHGSPGQVFAQADVLRSLGLEPPMASVLAGILRSRGWPLPEHLLRLDQLLKALEVEQAR
jgi:energy-coupling factor transport system ATP-binding protein